MIDVFRTIEQGVDQARSLIRARVGDEGLNLFRRWENPYGIEEDAADENPIG